MEGKSMLKEETELHIPTEPSSSDHRARLTFPLGLLVLIDSITLTIRMIEKKTMTNARQNIPPIPIFCFMEMRRPTRSRIGKAIIIRSVTMSIVVAM
jgi:hypothetical protein